MLVAAILCLDAVPSIAQISLTCNFGNRTIDALNLYSCTLIRTLVIEKYENISVGGTHAIGYSNSDVTGLVIEYSRTSFIITELFRLFPKLKSYWININELDRLPGMIFSSAPNLYGLYIQSAGLQIIDEDAFVGLHLLQKLVLSSNKISHLPRGVFHPLRNVNTIDVRLNQITRLHSELFLQNAAYLYDLYLNNNNIREIGLNFLVNLVALNNLYLNNNNCTNAYWLRGNSVRLDFVAIGKILDPCFKNYEETSEITQVPVRSSLLLDNESI